MASVRVNDCYFDKTALCGYLSLSKRSVEKYEGLGLPYYRLDRKHLYRMSEVDEWLKRYRHNTADVKRMVEKICKG